MRRLQAYIPYLTAAVLAINGFVTLYTGLVEIFHLDQYLALEFDEFREYFEVTPQPQLGGVVMVALGSLLLALGKGLINRHKSAWRWAMAVMGLVLLNNLYLGMPLQSSILSVVMLVLLGVFNRTFDQIAERHQWNYTELIAVIAVAFALAYGVIGAYLMRQEFSGIENWTDAVYFTIVTYSTLGYGDILPQTGNAKIFTMTMVFIGLSSFVTALTVLLGPIFEARVKGVFSVMSKFQKTVNHVVVCGYTNVSESIVDELRDRGTPFVLIEERESMVQHLKSSGFDVLEGDPTERRTLEQANLLNATAVIAATDSDATNTLVALTARELRDSSAQIDFRIIVRVEDEENIEKVRHIGADEIVSPSTLGGRLMGQKAVGGD